jgi:hypothetical protein
MPELSDAHNAIMPISPTNDELVTPAPHIDHQIVPIHRRTGVMTRDFGLPLAMTEKVGTEIKQQSSRISSNNALAKSSTFDVAFENTDQLPSTDPPLNFWPILIIN